MAITEKAFNTNYINLTKTPLSISKVEAKLNDTDTYFQSDIPYTVGGTVIELNRSVAELKVTYTEKVAEFESKTAKNKINEQLKFYQAALDKPGLLDNANDAKAKNVSVNGSKQVEIGKIAGGFEAINRSYESNVTITEQPIIAEMTLDVPESKTTETSAHKTSIATLTGLTVTDGFTHEVITLNSAKGIDTVLNGILNTKEARRTTALKEVSPVSDEVEKAIRENIPQLVTTKSAEVAEKSITQLGNPPGSSTSKFGALGQPFANHLAAHMASITGSKQAQSFGDVVSSLGDGVEVPSGEVLPENIIDDDGSTNLAKTIDPGKDTNKNITTTRETYNMGSSGNLWRGANTITSGVGTYKFELVHTAEELETELSNCSRKLTTGVVHWSKTFNNEAATAAQIHELHTARQTASKGGGAAGLTALRNAGTEGGISWHYCILRDGSLQRGRPINVDSDTSCGYVLHTVHVGFIAGYNASIGVANPDIYLDPASITSQQWKTFDWFCKAFYKAIPGGEMLSHRDIDKASTCPGFDVPLYVAGKFNKTTIYSEDLLASSQADAFSPEELTNYIPNEVAESTYMLETASDRAVANTTAATFDAAGAIADWIEFRPRLFAATREVRKREEELLQLSESTATDKELARRQVIAVELKTKIETLRKNLVNNGYVLDASTDIWSKLTVA